jgi:pimeloyl-ACP methyl ester carboxylesterase
MADYVEIGGMRTWYDEHGKGDPLVLMHGGLTDARAFDANVDALADHFHVHTPERQGHGHTPDVEGPLTYEGMAWDTIEFLDTVVGGPAHLVGWSDGANIAMLTALQRPDLVRRMVLVSGNFHHDGAVPEILAETDVNPASVPPLMEPLAAAYGQVSPDGQEHFIVMVRKVLQLATTSPTLATDDLGRITNRTLVMAGDDDMIAAEHTVALYRALPNSELAVIPGTSHFLLAEKPALCNMLVVDFLTTEPAPTMMPIRRAA